MKVYLAGGFSSGWQETVMGLVPGPDYYDPRNNSTSDPREYTALDMKAIEECDVVFAYLEKYNPVGYNLAFEVGYAIGLNKTVILVDEKHYGTQMMRQVCIVGDNLDDGLNILAFIVEHPPTDPWTQAVQEGFDDN